MKNRKKNLSPCQESNSRPQPYAKASNSPLQNERPALRAALAGDVNFVISFLVLHSLLHLSGSIFFM